MTDAHHNIELARRTYSIPYWSNDYFFINTQGVVEVRPSRHDAHSIALTELVRLAKAQHLTLPLLVRFPNIIEDRIKQLSMAFQQAMTKEHYQATYTAVYPIKVNQQKEVVDAVNQQFGTHTIGLEAGSKPELLAVLALAKPGQIIICNGYKDRLFMRYALIGQSLGHQVYVIIEKISELKLLIDEAKHLNLKPQIGVRVKLASIGTGKWQNTGGEKGKFGLTATQVLAAIDMLKHENLLDCLQVMHFHMGSQIANIRDIQKGLHEAARFFCDLKHLGATLKYADVGGGLGIDYEGNNSRGDCSINYTVEEYAHNVVKIFADICKEHQLDPPHLITEAGRAMVAHHAVLITNIIDTEKAPGNTTPATPSPNAHPQLKALWQNYETVCSRTVIESFHEVQYALGELQSLFTYGQINLQERAAAESIYFAFLHKIKPLLSPQIRAHRALSDELNEKLATKLFMNFSVFQSIPDVWAIEQIFPIMPLSHLDLPLTERGIVEDLTCDSDGRIDRYIDSQNIESTCPLPHFDPQNPYLMGIFLVGAYQETLGDIHNLFGDTDTVNVLWDNTQMKFILQNSKKGDDAKQVLNCVNLGQDILLKRLKEKSQQHKQKTELLAHLLQGFENSTYLTL